MARKRTSPLEDLVFVLSKLPWWAGLTLALLSYAVLHGIATRPLPSVATGPGALGAAASASLFRTLALFGQFLLPFACGIAALVSFVNATKQKKLYDNTASRPGVSALNDMSWQEFEMLVSEHYRRKGFQVTREGGNGPDGGVDLVLRQKSETYLVQCKQWKAYKVGVQPVREFYGVMAARGAAGGYFVTSGEYTADAKAFAQRRNLELIDGRKLRAMIDAARSKPATSTAPTIASSQVATSQRCPKCGAEMVRRIAKQGSNAGKEFWGCSTYPKCKGSSPINDAPQPAAAVPVDQKSCPDCGTELVLRQFQSGPRTGQQFYGCLTCKKGWPLTEDSSSRGKEGYMPELFDEKIEAEDVVYRNIRDITKYADDRAYAEKLWLKFNKLADKEFIREFPRDFHARYWEMYLANALLDAGHALGACEKNHGPDLFIDQGEEKIWIEAVIAKKGEGKDAPKAVDAGLREIAPGFRSSLVAEELSDDPIILRYRTAISYKFDKYNKYLKANIIKSHQPFVVALNGAEVPFDFVKDDMPRIVKALFALGNEQCVVDTSTMEVVAASFQYKPSIVKKSGSGVETDIFLNDTHEGISAIIYACENVCNRIAPLGSGFVVIHNPFAKNPLPRGFLKVGTEYWVEGDQLKFSRFDTP